MPDFLSLSLLGDRNLTRNLEQLPGVVNQVLLEKLKVLANELADKVEDNIGNRLGRGNKPKTYSGSPKHMIDSVGVSVRIINGAVSASVFIDGIPYAKAQEKGAIVPPHMIYPKRVQLLSFIGSRGDRVFASRVSHPGGRIPATFFMRDAYKEMSPQISKEIKKAIVKGIQAQMRSRR